VQRRRLGRPAAGDAFFVYAATTIAVAFTLPSRASFASRIATTLTALVLRPSLTYLLRTKTDVVRLLFECFPTFDDLEMFGLELALGVQQLTFHLSVMSLDLALQFTMHVFNRMLDFVRLVSETGFVKIRHRLVHVFHTMLERLVQLVNAMLVLFHQVVAMTLEFVRVRFEFKHLHLNLAKALTKLHFGVIIVIVARLVITVDAFLAKLVTHPRLIAVTAAMTHRLSAEVPADRGELEQSVDVDLVVIDIDVEFPQHGADDVDEFILIDLAQQHPHHGTDVSELELDLTEVTDDLDVQAFELVHRFEMPAYIGFVELAVRFDAFALRLRYAFEVEIERDGRFDVELLGDEFHNEVDDDVGVLIGPRDRVILFGHRLESGDEFVHAAFGIDRCMTVVIIRVVHGGRGAGRCRCGLRR